LNHTGSPAKPGVNPRSVRISDDSLFLEIIEHRAQAIGLFPSDKPLGTDGHGPYLALEPSVAASGRRGKNGQEQPLPR
jgi:hypothetical protein